MFQTKTGPPRKPRKGKAAKSGAWFSRADMAQIFDCTVGNFDARIRPAIPDDCVKKENRRLLFHARGVINAWAAREAAKLAPAADPLMDGTSPELERYRKARASLAELELESRKGALLDRRVVHEGLSAIAGIYRRAGARLRHEFGDAAYQIVEECWDDATRKIESMFGDATPKDDRGRPIG